MEILYKGENNLTLNSIKKIYVSLFAFLFSSSDEVPKTPMIISLFVS